MRNDDVEDFYNSQDIWKLEIHEHIIRADTAIVQFADIIFSKNFEISNAFKVFC